MNYKLKITITKNSTSWAFNLKTIRNHIQITFHRNTSVPELYEIALRDEKGSAISDVGALVVLFW
jgi:hypothetical protein